MSTLSLQPTTLVECPRCSGTGLVQQFIHRDNGVCYQCSGTGKCKGHAVPAQQSNKLSYRKFFEMLEAHDWFYTFSDDSAVYKRGNKAEQRLAKIASRNKVTSIMLADYEEYISDRIMHEESSRTLAKPELENYRRLVTAERDPS